MYDDKLPAQEAPRAGRREDQRVEWIEADFREEVVQEVVRTGRVAERARGAVRVSQFVDYFFYLVYALLGIRAVLALAGANSEAGFVRLIRALTAPLYAPFRGILDSPTDPAGHTLALPVIVAIMVYGLCHLGLNGVLRLFAERKTEI